MSLDRILAGFEKWRHDTRIRCDKWVSVHQAKGKAVWGIAEASTSESVRMLCYQEESKTQDADRGNPHAVASGWYSLKVVDIKDNLREHYGGIKLILGVSHSAAHFYGM